MRQAAIGSGLVVFLSLATLAGGAARAQCVLQDWTQEEHVSAGLLGWDLAVDGDVAVATSVEDFAPGVHHIWIWRRVAGVWVQAEPLLPLQAPQTASGATDRVALDDGVLAIGRNDLVHVYRDDGQDWNLEAVLSVPTPGPFGRSLALQGEVLVVGRPAAAPAVGSAYVYRHGPSGWTLEDELHSATAQLFGVSVAIHGNEIAIGDSHDNTNGPLRGAVHQFYKVGSVWQQGPTLYGDAKTGYEFGRHVEMNAGGIVVEGSHEVLGAYPPLLSFFFPLGGLWETEALPVLPEGTQSADIDLEGDLLVAGLSSAANGAGAAVVYRRSGAGWTLEGTVTAPQPGPQDKLGWSVALDGERVFATATQADGYWPDLGRLYEAGGVPGVPWWSSVGPALAGSEGEPCLFLEGSGSLGLQATLVLAQAAPGAPAALVVGISNVSLPLKGGTLVPEPNLIVAGLVVPASGRLELDLVWPDFPPGFELYVQGWIVDAQAVSGYAASNGLEILPP
jgi:hypothetical protein